MARRCLKHLGKKKKKNYVLPAGPDGTRGSAQSLRCSFLSIVLGATCRYLACRPSLWHAIPSHVWAYCSCCQYSLQRPTCCCNSVSACWAGLSVFLSTRSCSLSQMKLLSHAPSPALSRFFLRLWFNLRLPFLRCPQICPCVCWLDLVLTPCEAPKDSNLSFTVVQDGLPALKHLQDRHLIPGYEEKVLKIFLLRRPENISR